MAIKGHLHTISITGILQLLCDENKSGVLRAYNQDNQVKFFLKDGSILCVMGTLPKARLGNILENSNVISEEDLNTCLQLSKTKNQTLGKILVDEGFINFDTLSAVVTKQAETIISDLLSWDSGIFEYKDGNIQLKNMIITPINVMGLILEASRQRDEFITLKTSEHIIDVTEEEITDDRFIIHETDENNGQNMILSDLKTESANEIDSDDDEIIDISEEERNKFWNHGKIRSLG